MAHASEFTELDIYEAVRWEKFLRKWNLKTRREADNMIMALKSFMS